MNEARLAIACATRVDANGGALPVASLAGGSGAVVVGGDPRSFMLIACWRRGFSSVMLALSDRFDASSGVLLMLSDSMLQRRRQIFGEPVAHVGKLGRKL